MGIKRDPNSRIARKIIAKKTLARGVVVLDVGLSGLMPALRDANIGVLEFHPKVSHDQLLFHRIIVTSNPAGFVDDAPVYEYGVIALDKLGSIDSSPTYRKNTTVRLLSKAMSRYHLWEKGAKFLLQLRDDGNHQLEELT
jgi:hypothetical protein